MPDSPREEPLAEPISIEEVRAKLLSLLRPGSAPSDRDRPRQLIERLERECPADLGRDSTLLTGVWELRWTTSALPSQAVAPWIDNLQVLEPERGRRPNRLRLAGPLGPAAGIAVQ
ncbi:MAG: PAP fibrillin, partial [Cyanobium sp.]